LRKALSSFFFLPASVIGATPVVSLTSTASFYRSFLKTGMNEEKAFSIKAEAASGCQLPFGSFPFPISRR